ncbi:MAG: S1C family serine protease [Acidobacteriota bacterium]
MIFNGSQRKSSSTGQHHRQSADLTRRTGALLMVVLFLGLGADQQPTEPAVGDAAQLANQNPLQERSWAGFGGAPIDQAMAARLELERAEGVVVTVVHSESPAAKAGIEARDLVLEADMVRITDARAWSASIATLRPGTTIDLLVQRQGERLHLRLTIEQLPAQPS